MPSASPSSGSSTTTRRIVDAITGAIVERRLPPGTKLVEQKLADAFSVSRTIVRQALNQLSRDRLVTLEPRRGAHVTRPSVEEARQVFEVRRWLEQAMVQQLCARITEGQIAELRRHLHAEARAVAGNDIPGRTRLLADFHLQMAHMLGNDVLSQLLADLLSRSSLIPLMLQSTRSAEHSREEHAAIVDAIARRDVRAAMRLSASHIDNVERNLHLDPRSDDFESLFNPATPATTAA